MKWVFEELSRGILTVRSVMDAAIIKGLTGRTGRPVDKNSFWRAIRNPVYIGKIRVEGFKGEEEMLVAGQHAPLIKAEIFYRVQDVLDGKRKPMRTKVKVDEKFPLRGFLLCPTCGRALTASSSKGRTGYHHYYHCYRGCATRFRSLLVNNAFVDELKLWKPSPGAADLYKYIVRKLLKNEGGSRQQEEIKIRDELVGLEAYKAQLRKLRINGELDLEDYTMEKREVEAKIACAESQLESLANRENINSELEKACHLFQELDTLWERSSVEWKRSFIGSMIPEKLVFYGSGFRTSRINTAAQLIFSMDTAFGKK